MKNVTFVFSVLCILSSTACFEPLAAGEWGTLRYFAEVPGTAPLRTAPPVSDREGNIYVTYGSPNRNDAGPDDPTSYVGHAMGGWSGGCTLHKGDTRGAHGWVGTAEARAWYWSGDALVEVSGTTGECAMILDRDPTTGADLRFVSVFPWVEDTPSYTRAPAMVRTPTESLPYHVTIDFNLGRYTNLRRFEPADAQNVVVAGVGANPREQEAWYVVSYELDGVSHVEARTVDMNSNTRSIVVIQDAPALAQDSIQGYLQGSDGLVAGLLASGDVVVFSRAGGWVQSVPGMLPVGVHRRGTELWVVGTAGGRPQVARIRADGSIGEARLWRASEEAAHHLGGALDVLDDRADPSPTVQWWDARSAMGPFPFLHAHSPDPYADHTTGWLIAGPFYQTGIEGMTSVAFGPVGISYP